MAEIANLKRPCCLLLRTLSQNPKVLADPEETAKALETIANNCVLMQLVGKSRVKIDLTKSDCFLAVDPDNAQEIIDEIGKTVASDSHLEKFYDLLSKINGVLSNNTKIQQFIDKILPLLAQLREGERKFGGVPDTKIIKDNERRNALSAGDLLKAHPILASKTQFDGINPKSNPDTTQNPEAQERAQELQNRLLNQLKPGLSPKYRPPGAGGN